ncbi:FAD-dependent oxidoreductase [Mycobacterium sp. 21AC1]|uniref:NAD(P)/FAD-dependent oxidoreductase n=1 Tax=[Mycobacterium] appelbergii TaxID=2939269 RepID=UPI002938F118|nr:FAD-dependent oxidoreductase [Mycobacterium sp. 21AC1]MDV3127317.1 FAD-dependent oxidoreductase [Mycobacterium sp. 21AC1]
MSGDVVVVGGGVAGMTVAYELALHGASVTVLERGEDVGGECSSGNAGMVASTHAMPLASPGALREGLRYMLRADSPFYLRPRPGMVPWLLRYGMASTPARARAAGRLLLDLTQAGLEAHRQMQADGLETGLQTRGHLDAYESQAGMDSGRAEIQHRHARGLPGELLSPDELLKFEPSLSKTLAGGAFYEDQAWCDPLVFIRAIAAAATGLGVTIKKRVEVLGLERKADRIVAARTTAGRITGDTFVIAAGVWCRPLARSAGLYLPVEGGKGYHVELPESAAPLRVPVYMADSRVVATPLPGRLRLSGTFELDGLDDRVDPIRVRAITAAGVRVLPGLSGMEAVGVWRGLRPCAPDGLPLVGAIPWTQNLLVDTGHGIGGITTAPVTARLISEVIRGVPTSLPMDLMRPDRFKSLATWARRDKAMAGEAVVG